MKKLLLLLVLIVSMSLTSVYAQREPYAVLSNGTLTFYYNSDKPYGAYSLIYKDQPEWKNVSKDIRKVVIDDSFSACRLTNCKRLFYEMSNLTTIEGLDENFNTSNVTSMVAMFSGCESLGELDLSNFNTSNVTEMGDMFRGCKGLTRLDLSSFDTRNVKRMNHMFIDCSNLRSIDLSSFTTPNLVVVRYMFNGCKSLESLDLSRFNTSNVGDMAKMFYDCTNLSDVRFGSQFNTANVTVMREMFANCKSLQTLDLTSFDTQQVELMYDMFNGCSNLMTIYVGDNWDTGKVEQDENMFSGCTMLTGGKGTKFNSSKTDKTYARIDGGSYAPGYFTKGEYSKEQNTSYVDLGLPSGTLWASCNVGAEEPWESGNYFAWGEVERKLFYDWETYKYSQDSTEALTKYCQNPENGYNGFTDNLTVLEPSDDAATQNMGSSWRMPTRHEFMELADFCDWEWSDDYKNSEVAGFIIRSKKDRDAYIFLPAAGVTEFLFQISNTDKLGNFGVYWTSMQSKAFIFNKDENAVNVVTRRIGCAVRAVKNK